MSLELFVCVPRAEAVPAGEVLAFRHPQPFHRNATSFTDSVAQDPGTLVVLQVEGLEYNTDDPHFDPYRNWLTELTAAKVVREVPARELVRA